MGMLDYFARYWWTVAVRGALAVLFCLAAWIWPDVTIRLGFRLRQLGQRGTALA
jgi:hypothetical protein